ncbi:uncharacterized membrane protein YcaP (DUF421 family) [Amycolatopsis bartoniae]|uniref:DUF421 domain-containing protein n=1 Tax=Amycolatopsis bartoniae TaxID=941986 RepID=A0A8H9MB31_9PSEU|nr:YetF domain-containing protein [Amycolatopsis bartoniae]MBB2938055.1 uncharacterized membrane protein YcaP (DUF421 family) [Amycolatopsis bartoniae]GHF32378.1 DUF421 domain-containing protein [Amycolatopsis bartoniae]
MAELIGSWSSLGWVCAKAALLALTALAGLRLAPRRALAEMRIFDFVVAVAVGSIVGRTATASGTSFLVGLVALVTLLAVHVVLARLRFLPRVARALDHPVRVLVRDGEVDREQLRRCLLTEDDLRGALRQRGVTSLAEVRFVLYESQGGITVVREGDGGELLGGTPADRKLFDR